MTDYNISGAEYDAHVQNVGFANSGYMGRDAVMLKLHLLASLNEGAKAQNDRLFVRSFLGMLHHLDAFLLSVERAVDGVDRIRKGGLHPDLDPEYFRIIVKRAGTGAPLQPPALIGINCTPLLVELETLLLRGVSALERLAKLVEEITNIRVPNFYNLRNILASNLTAHSAIPKLLVVLDAALPEITGTLVSDGNGVSLRNAVAHRVSSPEIMEKGISIHLLDDGRLLAFDCELAGYPVVGTIYSLAQIVPYFILSAMKELLADLPDGPSQQWVRNANFTSSIFKPTWKNPFVHYSKFIDPANAGPRVSLIAFGPGGWHPHQEHLLPDVFTHAVTLGSEASTRKTSK